MIRIFRNYFQCGWLKTWTNGFRDLCSILWSFADSIWSLKRFIELVGSSFSGHWRWVYNLSPNFPSIKLRCLFSPDKGWVLCKYLLSVSILQQWDPCQNCRLLEVFYLCFKNVTLTFLPFFFCNAILLSPYPVKCFSMEICIWRHYLIQAHYFIFGLSYSCYIYLLTKKVVSDQVIQNNYSVYIDRHR